MTLIESPPGESDADLRIVADGILQTLDPSKPKWWHPYELLGTYLYKDKQFREFWCIAGSVQIWLRKLSQEQHLRQVVWLPDDKDDRIIRLLV